MQCQVLGGEILTTTRDRLRLWVNERGFVFLFCVLADSAVVSASGSILHTPHSGRLNNCNTEVYCWIARRARSLSPPSLPASLSLECTDARRGFGRVLLRYPRSYLPSLFFLDIFFPLSFLTQLFLRKVLVR